MPLLPHHVWLFGVTWTTAPKAPLPMEFSRQEYWSRVQFPTPGDPYPGIELGSLAPALAGGFFTTSATLYQFSTVQSLSHVQLFVTLWTTARQASLSITNSRSLLKLMSIESVMPSSHLLSPSAFSLSQHQSLFQWVSCSHQLAKILEFQLQHPPFQWIFRTDFP